MKVLSPTQLLCVAAATVGAFPSTAARDYGTGQPNQPKCRFAKSWSQKSILQNPSGFEQDLLYREGRFHQNNVSYNSQNGMTYDGTQLNWTTGERTLKHPFSAASKEVGSSTFIIVCVCLVVLY